MLNHISVLRACCLRYNKNCIQKVSIMFFMVDYTMIGGNVSRTQSSKTIDMMCVPIPKVFNLRTLFLYSSENFFLIVTVLKKTCRGPARIGSRLYHARYFNFELLALALIYSNDSPPRFVSIITVAFIENGIQNTLIN